MARIQFILTMLISAATAFLMHCIGIATPSPSEQNLLLWLYPLILTVPTAIFAIFKLLNFRNIDSFILWDYSTYCSLVPAVILACIPAPPGEFISWNIIILTFVFLTKCSLFVVLLITNSTRSNTKLNAALFLFVAWFFGSTAVWSSSARFAAGDEPHYLLMSHSLINDGNLNLFDEYFNKEYTPFYPQQLEPKPSDLVTPSRIQSRGLGSIFSIIIAPAYLLGGFYGVIALMVIISTALIFNCFKLYVTATGNAQASLISAFFVMSTLPILTYSSCIYPDIFAALIIIFATRLFQIPPATRQGRLVPLKILFLSIFLLFLKFRYVSIVVIFIFFACRRQNRRRNRSLTYFSGILVLIALYFVADWYVFNGDLFAYRFGGVNKLRNFMPNLRSISVLFGILIDQESGLLFFSPIYFLSLAGIASWPKPKDTAYRIAILATPVIIISLMGHFAWHSLPTPPLRYLLPALPLLGLFGTQAIKTWKSTNRYLRIIACSMAIYSIGVSVLILIQPNWLINLADGSAAMFEALSIQLNTHVFLMLPSLIRINSAVLTWVFILIALLCIIFFVKRKFEIQDRSISLPLESLLTRSIAAMLFCLFGLLYSADVSCPRTVNAEDRFLSKPNGGHYYPEKQDPFYHRETDYGWTLKPGTSISPQFKLPAGKSNLLIRARTLNSPYVCTLTIQDSFNSVNTSLSISNAEWTDYLIPLRQAESGKSTIKCSLQGRSPDNVAIDKIVLFPSSNWRWSVYSSLSRFLYPGLRFKSLFQGLKYHPGDPWYQFESFFQPTKMHHRPMPEIKHYKISQTQIQELFDLCLTLDWRSLDQLENAFGFSAVGKIPEDTITAYLTQKVSSGLTHDIQKKIISEGNNSPAVNLKLIEAIAYFRYRQYSKTIETLRNVQVDNWSYVYLSNPIRASNVVPELRSFLKRMADAPEYKNQIDKIIQAHLRQAQYNYRKNNFTEAASELFNLYRLNSDYFVKTLAELPRPFVIKLLPKVQITSSDSLKLCELYLQNRRYKEAELAARKASLRYSSSSEVRLMLARTLFHCGRLDEAGEQCILAFTLDFKEDRARNLLETIRQAERFKQRHLGKSISHLR